MPAASSTRDSATADSRPIRRASRGATGAKAPKHSTGTAVSSPANTPERPVSARRSPSTGATETTAGRWFSATATIAPVSRTVAVRDREVPVVPPSSIGATSPHRRPGGAGPPGAPAPSGGGGQHPRADGGVGRLVDQDEPAGDPVSGVVVDEQRLRGAQLHSADVVEPELRGLHVPVQRVDVEPVLQVLDHGADRAGA